MRNVPGNPILMKNGGSLIKKMSVELTYLLANHLATIL